MKYINLFTLLLGMSVLSIPASAANCTNFQFSGPASSSHSPAVAYCEHDTMVEIQYDVTSSQGMATEQQVTALLAQVSLKPSTSSLAARPIHTTVVPIDQIVPIRADLEKVPGVVIRPVYANGSDKQTYLAPLGELMVQFADTTTLARVDELARKFQLNVKSLKALVFVFSRSDLTGQTDLEVAATLAKEPEVVYSQPNFWHVQSASPF